MTDAIQEAINTAFEPEKIDPPGATGENQGFIPEEPELEQQEAKPEKMTAKDAVAKAFEQASKGKEVKAEDAEGDGEADGDEDAEDVKAKAKADKDAKAAKEDGDEGDESDGKEGAKKVEAEKPDTGERVAKKSDAQSEGRKIIEAPARFLPRARELWQNVPHPVREEWVRAEQEREQEIAQYRESHQFREELREFEELGRQHGVTVKQALSNYVDIERKFYENPAEGFKRLLSNMQMQPVQAIGAILQAYGVSPQALAQHIAQAPHEYTGLKARGVPQAANMQAQPQQAAQQPQPNPEIDHLKQELMSLKAQTVAERVIQPFAEEYPEYYQYEGQIAEVLKSGIIERIHGSGISPRDKLEAALLMVAPHVAKRSVDTAHDSEVPVPPAERDDKPAVDLRGKKSITGAPNGVNTNSRRKLSKQEAIARAMAELGG